MSAHDVHEADQGMLHDPHVCLAEVNIVCARCSEAQFCPWSENKSERQARRTQRQSKSKFLSCQHVFDLSRCDAELVLARKFLCEKYGSCALCSVHWNYSSLRA